MRLGNGRGQRAVQHKICHLAEGALGECRLISARSTTKSDGGRCDAPVLEGAFFRGTAFELCKPSCFFLAAQPFFFARAQLVLGWTHGRGLRAVRFKLGQFEIHAQLLKRAIAGGEFIPELLLGGFRGRLQGGNLCGQRIDGLGGSRVLLDHRFGRIAQLLDLGLQRGDLCQKFGVGLCGRRRDQHHLGFGRGKGLDGAKAVALVLKHIRGRRGQRFFFLGLRDEIEQCPARPDHENDDQSQKWRAPWCRRRTTGAALLEGSEALFQLGVLGVAHEAAPSGGVA